MKRVLAEGTEVIADCVHAELHQPEQPSRLSRARRRRFTVSAGNYLYDTDKRRGGS